MCSLYKFIVVEREEKRKNSMDVSKKCIVMQHKTFTFHFGFFPGFVEFKLIASASMPSSEVHQLEGSSVLKFQVNRRIAKWLWTQLYFSGLLTLGQGWDVSLCIVIAPRAEHPLVAGSSMPLAISESWAWWCKYFRTQVTETPHTLNSPMYWIDLT